jgi:hypothetical protein
VTNVPLVTRKLGVMQEHLRRLTERRPADVASLRTNTPTRVGKWLPLTATRSWCSRGTRSSRTTLPLPSLAPRSSETGSRMGTRLWMSSGSGTSSRRASRPLEPSVARSPSTSSDRQRSPDTARPRRSAWSGRKLCDDLFQRLWVRFRQGRERGARSTRVVVGVPVLDRIDLALEREEPLHRGPCRRRSRPRRRSACRAGCRSRRPR